MAQTARERAIHARKKGIVFVPTAKDRAMAKTMNNNVRIRKKAFPCKKCGRPSSLHGQTVCNNCVKHGGKK